MNAHSDLSAGLLKALQHLEHELKKMQIGRASTSVVEGLLVEAYGMTQPLKAMATLSTPDSHTIQIQPWDKSVLQNIEKAIAESDLMLTPNNDGNVIRISIPAPTGERRDDLCKVVQKYGEDAKISIRNARHASIDGIKKKKEAKELSQDLYESQEKGIQKEVDDANKKVDEVVKGKVEEIRKV